MMNMENMKAAFADEVFVKGLFELETVAEVQVALKEKGIELTEEEILKLREFILKVESGEIPAEQVEQWTAQMESGELPEELLEQVAGGVVLTTGAMVACGVLHVLKIVGIVAGSFGATVGLAHGIADAQERRW